MQMLHGLLRSHCAESEHLLRLDRKEKEKRHLLFPAIAFCTGLDHPSSLCWERVHSELIGTRLRGWVFGSKIVPLKVGQNFPPSTWTPRPCILSREFVCIRWCFH